jgi:hypothetical protein
VIRTGGQGAILRDAPAGSSIGFMAEAEEVRVIGGPVVSEGSSWWQVLTTEDEQGWVLGDLLATLTPTASITSSFTLSPTP